MSNVIRNMTTKLTWEDLFSQDPQIDFGRIFSCWPQVPGKVLPIGLSAFGDAFFVKPDESVWMLDTFCGQVRKVAETQAEFGTHMSSQTWQEQCLRSNLVFELRERGLKRGPLQVFAPVPHPAFANEIRLEKAQVMDAVVWHSISSQALAQRDKGAIANAPNNAVSEKPWWRVW